MILKRLILVLLAMFLVMGCAGAVSAEGEPTITSFAATQESGTLTVTFTYNVGDATSLTIKYFEGDDEHTISGTSTSHPYSTSGSYTATLNATNINGTTLKSSTFTVEPIIEASFTTNISSGVAPLTVQFTDTSTGSPSEYNWTFGSAGTSTEKDPTYTFTTPGEYDVVLNVSTDTAYSVSTPQRITVTPRVITDVDIFGLDAPVSGQSPDYSASVSSTPNGNVNSTPVVSWYAPNGAPFTGNFANGTIYKAIVTIEATNNYTFASDIGFDVDDATSISRVLESNNRIVNVTCIYPATEAEIKDITSVSISGVTLPVGGATKNTSKPSISSTPSGGIASISNITWKEDSDGSTSGTVFKYETIYMAVITVEAESGYKFTSGSTAKLNGKTAVLVTDTDGRSATITYTCKTAAEGKIHPVITKFTVTPTSGTSPLDVRFTVATTNATNVTLNFGDGVIIPSTKNGYVDHTYSIAGNYYPILTATNTNGSVTESLSILVKAPLATSTPTQTAAVKSLTTASAETGNMSMIPAPLDIIKEFMHLFYSIFDPANYLFAVNESGNTS